MQFVDREPAQASGENMPIQMSIAHRDRQENN